MMTLAQYAKAQELTHAYALAEYAVGHCTAMMYLNPGAAPVHAGRLDTAVKAAKSAEQRLNEYMGAITLFTGEPA